MTGLTPISWMETRLPVTAARKSTKSCIAFCCRAAGSLEAARRSTLFRGAEALPSGGSGVCRWLLNISLAVFNLLPFPPLDGSKVLSTFLPASMQGMLDFLEQYGYWLLILLIYLGFFRAIIRPILEWVYYLLLLGVER